MSGSRVVILMVGLWVLMQALSFWMPSGIEGPRNLDTGFQRLDVWFRWQLAALVVALVAAISGFILAPKGWRNRTIGLTPATLTLVAALGLYLFVVFGNSGPGSTEAPKRQTTAPAATAPKVD